MTAVSRAAVKKNEEPSQTTGRNLVVPQKPRSTLLHRAVSSDCYTIVKYLIRRGANIQAKAEEDWTPLHVATKAGNLKMVMLLVENGANVAAINRHLFNFML
jgi:ankyrin repeat protein